VALFATNLERRLNGTFAKPSSKVVLKQDRERNLLGRAFHRGRKPVGSLGELEEFSAGFRSERFPDARVGWE